MLSSKKASQSEVSRLLVMIVEAFAANDRGLLKNLLDPALYAAFDGAIFFWEEIGETLYDIALDLHTLRHLGIFERIAGMLVGKLTWVNEYFAEVEHPEPREAIYLLMAAILFWRPAGLFPARG